MSLTLVRSADTRTLWDECVGRFLDGVGEHPGPDGFDAHVWLAQESQVDLLYETARERGLPGWLGPPVTMLRRLPERFEIRERRIGLLTRRRIISRVARSVAERLGMEDPSHGAGVVRGHMLDALFAELLPEGVGPDRLESALAGLETGDRFLTRRDAWVVGTYRGYLEELARRERIDARQINARVAAAIDSGSLPDALRGAGQLHVYGLYSLRSRQRLLVALAGQSDVDVHLYALASADEDSEGSEWDAFAARHGCGIREVAASGGTATDAIPEIRVQPTPDTQRETEWVARQVKRLLTERDVEPHRIAVIARSGEEDTGRVHRALGETGVTATTIVRSRLTEIPALKSLLALFRGAASGWNYRALRAVLDNSLLEIDIDLRTIDFIATTRRVAGLRAWEEQIEGLLEKLQDVYEDSGRPKDRDVRGSGLWADRVERDLGTFGAVREALEPLGESRTETAWIELTLGLLADEHPAAFHLRRQLCEPIGDRWETVRLDQRGVRQTESLLKEWRDLDHPRDPIGPDRWYELLRRMLEANELSITTPVHKGVQVLEAHDAALLPFEHVFVIHANDGVFPRTGHAGGILSNEERTRLRQAGVPLAWRDLDLQRERALWRAVTGAGEVTVTYRTADPTGTPLLPSLLVPPHEEEDELPRLRTAHEGDREDFLPVTSAQANQRAAVRLQEHLERVSAEPTPAHGPSTGGSPPAGEPARPPALEAGEPELMAHAVLGAVAEAHRDTGAIPLADSAPALHPNPWNGWLRDPRVLEALERRFPRERRWSASQLESYSKLPFQYLLQRVLYLEEMAEAEEEVTPLVHGSVAHDLLAGFYERVKDDLPTAFTDRAEAAFEEAAEEVLEAARAEDRWLGEEVLWKPEWERIRDRVRSYLAWELGHLAEKGERPELIEHGFGFGDEEIYLEGKDVHGRPSRLRLCGRIDRVDLGPKGDHVLDYKSGRTPGANDYRDGTALQAPLYMQVLENAGREVARGYYRSLKPSKSPTQYGGRVDRHKPEYDTALRFALSIPGRIRQGLFEPVLSRKSGSSWASWHPDRDIARSQAVLGEGNRYEDLEPVQPAPAPVSAEELEASLERDTGEERAEASPDPEGPPRLPFGEPGGADG